MKRFVFLVMAILMVFSLAACGGLLDPEETSDTTPTVTLPEETTLSNEWPSGLSYAADFLEPPFSGIERVTAGDGFTRVFYSEGSVSDAQLEAYYTQLTDAGLIKATGGLWAGTAYFNENYAVNIEVLEYVMIDILDRSVEKFAGINAYFE